MGTLFWDCRNFLCICIGLWIIVSCTIVYRFSKLYPGLWEGSLCVVTRHNWSNRQHIVSRQVGTRHLSICGIGFTMPAIVIKLCKKLQYWELGMGSWCEINWLSLIFTSHWVPVEKFWNSSTNFPNRKYFSWKQKNLGVAPVLVQIISWPGTLSS